MHFALTHGNLGQFADPRNAAELVCTAEDAGFESIWTIEHVVLPARYEPLYPETPDGRIPFATDYPIPDPLIWLTYAAALTERVKLGTAVLVVPQRNPLILAKEAATLHRLSGGRLILGVGAGWLREEFDALGATYEDRGRRLDESIEAMRALWTGQEVSYAGQSTNFSGVVSSPAPPGGSVPVHIGGFTVPAAKRAARLGDGFFPGGFDLERLAELLERFRKEATELGRDPDTIEITSRWTRDPAALSDIGRIRQLDELGVDRITVPTFLFDPMTVIDDLKRFGDEVIARY